MGAPAGNWNNIPPVPANQDYGIVGAWEYNYWFGFRQHAYPAEAPPPANVADGVAVGSLQITHDNVAYKINVALGTDGNDLIAGNGILIGAAGDDTLIGGAGNDHLIAGSGNNVLEGGKGADTLDGSDGWGVADYRNAQGAVTIHLDNSGNSGDQAAGDVYININGAFGSSFGDTLIGNGNANWMVGGLGNDTVTGGGGNDTLYGSEGDDQLIGGAGNDHLIGGAGNNVLEGGAGADILDGSDGCGVADYRNAATAVTVHLDNSGNAGDQAVGDTYINIVGAFGSNFGDSLFGDNGNNWIVACDGNDLVSGGRGDDILYGSNGDDTLIGGVGNDTLIGEAGRDIFVFNTALNAAGNVDQLSGFNIYEDRIQLDHGIFTTLATGTLSAAAFTTGAWATSAAQRILYNSATGDLSYDADGWGSQAAVKFAHVDVSAGTALKAELFFVV